MKITINCNGKTYSVETNDDINVEGMADVFKGLLVSMGYHPCNVDELINAECKWFTQAEIDDNRQGHLKVDKKVEEWQNNLYRVEDDDFDEYDIFK